MKRINWILTDNVASAVSFADMYRLGNPVDSDLIFLLTEGSLRKDTGFLECNAHTAVITQVMATKLIEANFLRDGHQRTLCAAADWYTGDRNFFRKVENVIFILNGVATYLKRPYTQPRREPITRRRLQAPTPLTFRNTLQALQPVLELSVHPTPALQVLRGQVHNA